MTFNSMQFVVFFAVVISLYWRLGHRDQNRMLLAASYLFYGWWDWRFLGLLALSTTIDYWCGLELGKTDDPRRRKRLLWTSMGANLTILGFFKYFNFFVDSLESGLNGAGLDWLAPSIGIVLPVGISFYTFQSMSYGIDVYRRELEPIRSFPDFALYVSYFPQLVAGPIERATHLVPQIIKPRIRPTAAQKSEAFALILVGLVKKVVVADLAAQVANDVFARPGEASFFELLIGVYCFAIQIYGDFSGYSDMARGTSKLLGIELMENFQQPYFSTTITEFWRRWHRSLSQWLRDYLYIPLGGNRKGARRTYINLSLTMLLGGLWHGAAWTFVVWGALQGLYLMVERAVGWDRSPRSSGARVGRTLITFHLTCLAWIFFRADDFGQAGQFIEGLVTLRGGEFPLLGLVNFLVPTALLLIAIDRLQLRLRNDPGLPRLHPRIQGMAYGLGAVAVLLASGGAPVPFVYFQF